MARTILVVDDNAIDRTLLQKILGEKYTVIAAASGDEMISVLRQRGKMLSAILLDLHIPETDGFEALRNIRDNAVYRQVPVIVASGRNDEETQARAFALGAAGFTSKPYNRDILLHLLENTISLREKSTLDNTFNVDSLTGLLNRRAFFRQAAERIQLREAGYFVLSCLDIENFKVINDQHGLDTGDKILKQIANKIGKAMNSLNGICFHDAADKFGMLYPAASLDSDVIREMHEAVMATEYLGHSIRIRVGRYIVDELTMPIGAMYDRATIAEESIKGRYDTYVAEYTEEMRQSLVNEQRVVNDMRRALEAGEFEPWFQPQYNHATGALIGAEALVRWRKDGKIVPPNAFIPIFERNGFIYQVDQYIWRSVCILLRRWLDEGRNPLPVSVNISRYDLFQKDFMDIICSLTEEYRLPSDLLRLEVTESAFTDSTNTIYAVVNELIKKGFTVEIDDFGSGYSSLNTLKDVPASILKLDMRFFEQTGDAKRGGNIVESMVRMAKWLGMAVIAEGVEDKAQADYLKSIGCYYIQGYYYAKPMPVEEYEKRLDTNSKEAQLTRLQTLQHLDNNEFWDSHSMDTLIFNSYVGAACILEFNKDKVEMLRSTDHFVRMLSGDLLDIKAVLAIDWTKHMDDGNVGLFKEAVAKSLETRESVSEEFEFHGLPGCPETVVLRCSLRVIATDGERRLIYCLNENITAQRAAERAALTASERINAVMDHCHSGITAVIARQDGTVELIFVNNRFFEMMGYTREQYMTEVESPYDRVLPEDRERVINTIINLNEIGSTASLELREMRRDGSIVWFRWDASVVRFANISEPVQLANFLDITEQKENEMNQLESARRLEAVMANINGGISAVYLKNDKPTYVIANEQYYNILGYTKEEFESDPPNPFDLLHSDDREWVRRKFVEGQKALERYTMEYRMIRRDGAVRHILCNTSVVHLLGIDEPVQLAVTNDITELREMQSKELSARNRLSVVMNAIPNGITAVTFHDGELKLLFANERFFELHGISRDDSGEKCLAAALDLVLPEYRESIDNAFRESEKTWKPVTYECRIRHSNGSIRWLRVLTNMTKLVGIDDPVRVAVSSDITDEKEAADQLRFLNDLAHDILAQADSEQAINDTLKKLLNYFSGERCYIFELDDETQTADNTYELCAAGITSEMERLQNVPYDIQQCWFDAFSKEGFVAIHDIADIEDSEAAMRELLSSQNIRSIIVAPLWRDENLIGYIGVDNPTKAVEQVGQLIALSDYIAVLLTRRDLIKTIEYGRKTVQQLIDDTPGGFLRLQIRPDAAPAIVSFNAGFCRMLGMTGEEVIAEYGDDAHKCVVSEDIATVKDAAAAALAGDGLYTCKCRLRKKDGTILWAQVIGRFVKDENGELFRNSYFTDITEKLTAEENQRALLDNLPFGAAMYEFDGDRLKALHINQQYQLMVGRNFSSAYREGRSPEDFIYPDDRSVALTAIRDAITNHRDASCNIRILHDENEYRSYHLDARIMAQPDGKYLVYVAYTRLSEQELTFENALPHMFSAIMESSTDLAFAKDINFRYICCSKTFATLLGLESEKEVVGKTDYELFPKEIADMFRKDDSALFATQKPQIDVQEMLPSPDGTKHYIRTSKHLLRSNTDAVIGIYCIGRDVTEIREAYAQLRLLTDSIPGGIATFRCSPGNIEAVYFNDGVCELVGYSREKYNKHPIPMLDFIFADDRPTIHRQIELLQSGETSLNFTFRVHTQESGYKWLNAVATAIDHVGDVYSVNTVLTDITEQQEERERLRLAEEEYRIATIHSGHTIGRYDIASQTLTISEDASVRLALPENINDVPYGRVKLGKISKATANEYIAFYEKIMHGEKECSVTFQKLLSVGWRWITERATTIFDDNGKPVSAIVSYSDVTDQQEKEAVYKKWQQNLKQKGPESYTLYRCNLNQNESYDTVEGELLDIHKDWDETDTRTFNERAYDFVERCVVAEDREIYLRFVNSDSMLANYYRGKRSASIEFRGLVSSGEIHWIRLSMELVEYPNTEDIAAYLMYEDVNDRKLMALRTQAMAETDPLTGLLNRKTFIARLDEMLATRKENALYALMLLDLDGFKLVNDSFGHAIGDQVLIDTAKAIKSILRDSDLVCRMGGDEFLVCMSAVPDRNIILKKAKRCIELLHSIVKLKVQLSASIGIAVCPDDGTTFEKLYPKVDKALYYIKSNGKDNCAFYDANIKTVLVGTDEHCITPIDPTVKPTMLIVDNHKDDNRQMSNVFAVNFKVEAVKDGRSALNYLRNSAKDVVVVLLALSLPDMDSLIVLEQIKEMESAANIPVVLLATMGERDAVLRVIKAGASDFITKPADPTLLRIRVESAISKAENERLRVQNRFLALLKNQEK